ncbi:hypothetical protein [Roseimaritima ulvae]|uniref:Bacterial extracellular solute-binding protein n=1 Tax=Roseimaritima ulvae TaxID=980254 RepID=A0A5B9QWL3_9BACT|nr:hypothetical protein [Roseimaritima ulvae]QEG41775.1 hypothetical protein UC8_38010 [Roseimaritima ulvae]
MNRNLSNLLRFLLGVGLAVTWVGCRKADSPDTDSAPAVSSNVPLRVAMVGSAEEAEAVQRAWLAVSDQPIEITAIESPESNAPESNAPASEDVGVRTAVNQRLVESAPQHDVLIYPAAHTGALQSAGAVRRLGNQFLSTRVDEQSEAPVLLPALRQGVMKYGSETIGVPLGAVQPVLLLPPTADESPQDWTWETYGQRVAALEPGQAAEPLADGWAAVAMLYRANSYCGTSWLFRGDELRPVLATAPYLRALRELQRDAAHYPEQRMDPAAVWQAASEGRLQLAISWPMTLDNLASDADLIIAPLPSSNEVFTGGDQQWQTRAEGRRQEWVLLTGQGPLASIASGCRQTSASESFLRWLSGNEGTASMRESVPGFTATHTDDSGASVGSTSQATAYDDVLQQQLANQYVRPLLRIPAADQYLQALDREVIAVLDGDKTPEDALVDASLAWEQITDAQDRRQQAKHWRMSQGMAR